MEYNKGVIDGIIVAVVGGIVVFILKYALKALFDIAKLNDNKVKDANEKFEEIIKYLIQQKHYLSKEMIKELAQKSALKYGIGVENIYSFQKIKNSIYINSLSSGTMTNKEKDHIRIAIENNVFWQADTEWVLHLKDCINPKNIIGSTLMTFIILSIYYLIIAWETIKKSQNVPITMQLKGYAGLFVFSIVVALILEIISTIAPWLKRKLENI